MIPSSPARHIIVRCRRDVDDERRWHGIRASRSPSHPTAGSRKSSGPREAAMTIHAAATAGPSRRTRSRRGHAAGLQRKATPELRTSVSNQPELWRLAGGRTGDPPEDRWAARGWRGIALGLPAVCCRRLLRLLMGDRLRADAMIVWARARTLVSKKQSTAKN